MRKVRIDEVNQSTQVKQYVHGKRGFTSMSVLYISSALSLALYFMFIDLDIINVECGLPESRDRLTYHFLYHHFLYTWHIIDA